MKREEVGRKLVLKAVEEEQSAISSRQDGVPTRGSLGNLGANSCLGWRVGWKTSRLPPPRFQGTDTVGLHPRAAGAEFLPASCSLSVQRGHGRTLK